MGAAGGPAAVTSHAPLPGATASRPAAAKWRAFSTSSRKRIGCPSISSRNECAISSRVSAGEPPRTFCTNTPPATRATLSPQRSSMHLGVPRSTRPAQMTRRASSSEPSSEGLTPTSTSSPSRRTLTATARGSSRPTRPPALPRRPWPPLVLAPRLRLRPRARPPVGRLATPSSQRRSAVSTSRLQVTVWPATLSSTSPGRKWPSEAPVGNTRWTRMARATWPCRPQLLPTACSQALGRRPEVPRASVATSMAPTSMSREGTCNGASGCRRNSSTRGAKTLAEMPNASVVSSCCDPCQSNAAKSARTLPLGSQSTPLRASSGLSARTTISRFRSRKRGTSQRGNSSRPLGRYTAATVTRVLKAFPWLSNPTKCSSSPARGAALSPAASFAACRGTFAFRRAFSAWGSQRITARLWRGCMKITSPSTVAEPASVTSTSPRDCGALWRSVSTRPRWASTRMPAPSALPW
mmetsp:Transcript_78618/g.244863  ORF Transcript_78618/g.244863 Transcript_78618/m.244863 type:complete len:467 (-) Transcript_78618:1016-2416(-)